MQKETTVTHRNHTDIWAYPDPAVAAARIRSSVISFSGASETSLLDIYTILLKYYMIMFK